MRKVLIHFTEGQAEALRELAHIRRTTVSAVVRQAVQHFYDLPEEHVTMGRPSHAITSNGAAPSPTPTAAATEER